MKNVFKSKKSSKMFFSQKVTILLKNDKDKKYKVEKVTKVKNKCIYI